MKNKCIITLILFVVSTSDVFASFTWPVKDCADSNGIGCWKCGDNCTVTLYQDGQIIVSGSGAVKGVYQSNTTFSGLSVKPTSLKIEEGITSLGTNAFYHVETITSLDLPDSLTSVGDDALGFFSVGVSKLVIGETNFSMGYGPGTRNIPLAKDVDVLCRGNVELCRAGKGGMFNVSGKNITITNEILDENGRLLEKWNRDGYSLYDENGNLIAEYSKSRELQKSYVYDPDGSIKAYDSNGRLVDVHGKKILTVDEATALVSRYDGKNTFTIRYR